MGDASKLNQRRLHLVRGIANRRGFAAWSGFQPTQAEGGGQESLLCAVMEVSLDAASLGVGGADDAGAGRSHFCQLSADLGAQAGVIHGGGSRADRRG
jgi:hypothetical protein